MEDLIVGIDLGTTHSAVGVVESGFPILLANEEGKRIIPSAVVYADGGTEVGVKALRRRGIDSVVTSVKRLMGRRTGEVDDYHLSLDQGDRLTVLGRSPEEVSADILKELKRIAEWRLEREVHKAVISVPAYFNDAQRAATKKAGEIAGLEVVRIINEPTAAALAYGLDKLDEKSRVAVYDLGGGTFDLSILEMQDGVFQVLSTCGDTRLGGDDLDAAILNWVGVNATDPMELARATTEAERVKKSLSENESETFRLPFADGGEGIEKKIIREDFEKLAAPFIERSIACCRRALADANTKLDELNAVILVGGSTRIPYVRSKVAEFFGKEPDLSQHPDEAIALGASIQAGVLSGAMRKMVLLDVTPLSLGIETFGGLMNVIIPRNSTIPTKAGEMFTNAMAGQRAMSIRVLQGEREMARDNWKLGDFDVEFEPAAKGRARVGVQFRIDENGILEVLARDTATGKDTILEIRNSAVDVDDEKVEQMVSESVEYAFEDMAERVFTEARIKAEELLPAVEQVLAQGDTLIDADEASAIRAAEADVRQAMEAKDANRLKAAVEKLDKATEAVAARLVELAMEQALNRRLDS